MIHTTPEFCSVTYEERGTSISTSTEASEKFDDNAKIQVHTRPITASLILIGGVAALVLAIAASVSFWCCGY